MKRINSNFTRKQRSSQQVPRKCAKGGISSISSTSESKRNSWAQNHMRLPGEDKSEHHWKMPSWPKTKKQRSPPPYDEQNIFNSRKRKICNLYIFKQPSLTPRCRWHCRAWPIGQCQWLCKVFCTCEYLREIQTLFDNTIANE